ncbi:MAG: histidine phosphatase family protein [Actinomycetota bacterium]|nr:histidine phosphatase family protein [Actinomycetota bacterium]
MELIVIRHARPERLEGIKGGADPALTAVGHRQSELVADWVRAEHLDAIYVSPMARARQTSQPIEEAMGIAAVVEPRIREYDATSSHYIPIEEVKQDKEAWKRWIARDEAADRSEFFAMVNEAFGEIAARHRGQRVAVVCHGGVINAVASGILGLGHRIFFNPHYTSINRMMVASSGERSIVSLNDIGHLHAFPDLILH